MSEQITVHEKKITKSDLMGVFIRCNLFQGAWNFERMQS
ncbi:PTS mannose transporter subunit IID, partial [Listeria monocytogenes]|nr:PTS mannose transporter subunit IID [Listeria monocytogenes]